jgi:hypothetical protein
MRDNTHRVLYILALTILGASLLWSADSSFSGTWKLNLTKSQLSGTTYTFSKTAAGLIRYDNAGFNLDFQPDGKEYASPDGGIVTVTAPSANVWDLTIKENGKVVQHTRDTLNGDSISWVTQLTGPDGKTVEQTGTDTRVSGGPGFIGKWKSGDVKGSATTLQIALDGTNGISVTFPEYQQTIKGAFDGRDYPVMNAGQKSKYTNAFEKTGPNTFKVTTKLSGKPYYTDVYTLSADGKSMTDEGMAVATKEKVKAVFDRQ